MCVQSCPVKKTSPILTRYAPCPTMSDTRIHLRMRSFKLMCVRIRAMPWMCPFSFRSPHSYDMGTWAVSPLVSTADFHAFERRVNQPRGACVPIATTYHEISESVAFGTSAPNMAAAPAVVRVVRFRYCSAMRCSSSRV